MNTLKSERTILIMAVVLIIVAVLGRLLPHAWNATPLVAASLFAGVYLGKKWAFIVPIVAMIISDIFIGFYSPIMMLAVYGSFALVGGIGIILQKYKGAVPVVLASLVGSTLFFFITNTAVWALYPLYPHTFVGLIESLLAGVPFYKNMLLGDVLYTGLLFGVYESVVLYCNVKGYRVNRV